MKKTFTRLSFIIVLVVSSYSVFAQKNFWSDISEAGINLKRDSKISLPKQYRTLRLDTANLISTLRTAPKEFTKAATNSPLVLLFPLADGSFKQFKIVETSIMEAGLAAKFPNIKTYSGQGIDDPYATIRIDWTSLGFHAMILSHVTGAVFIDPYAKGTVTDYISYNKKDYVSKMPFIEEGVIINKTPFNRSSGEKANSNLACIGGTLRKYRLAVACTAEYAVAVAGSKPTSAQVLSAIVTTVNRVDGVYETELDIRMVLVTNNDKIIFTDTDKEPFTGNDDPEVLIEESQMVIDSLIGSTHYDIGHTFSTGAGGYAGLGVVCNNGFKAQGVTGSEQPYADPYDIDYVAHEMGHQFGANHTFNAATGSCGHANGNLGTNAEPGSGVTIMAYAGICEASNDLQPNSIPYFHAVSLDEINDFVTGSGNSCAVSTVTGNNPPLVDAGSNYTIPKSTPFVLTGSATDADSDPLTYSWEQVNVDGPFTDWNHPLGDAPIFRSFVPVKTTERYFPRLSDVLGNTTTIGELLPDYARILKFRLTARDNRAGGGGVCSDTTKVTVAGNAGPFVVTAPDTSTIWQVGSFATITWDVANTNTSPVNCTNVTIELSTDGGLTFPITLLASTANDGLEEVVVPDNVTSTARIRIRALGNIFYDVSKANFSIVPTSEKGFTLSNPQPVVSCNNSTAGTVLNTNSLNQFVTPITLSASGNPAGTTVVFSANPINPGTNDSITLTGNIPAGIYYINITGTAGSVVKSRVIQFTVGLPTNTPVNKLPANNSIGNSFRPTFAWKPTTDAVSYNLVISTSSTFATAAQTVNNIVDSNYTLTTPLAANTQYYWHVVPGNSCGSGPASATFLFKTVAIVCAEPVYSKNVPLIIDTVDFTVTTSTLNIPVGGIIQDIDVVGIKGHHDAVQEISISLKSPSNTSLLLIDETCYGSQNFNLTFDDDGPNLHCPLDSQVAQPLYPLSFFNGENSTGTWTLLIRDLYAGDGGKLTNWGLRICTYQATALPVNWLAFTAEKNDNKAVVLQWSTANELNNNYYEIEKSSDGSTFTSIGKIDAGKNYSGLQQYLFNDLKPYAGDNYYRLKQVDKDGNLSYSKIVKVHFDGAAERFIVYPNPAVNKTTVRFLSEQKQVTIQLADASGKVVYKKNTSAVKAGEELDIPVKTFSKGLYVLTLKSGKTITNKKIMVQ